MMTHSKFEICPGCGANLPKLDGPTHRYIGASAGCWAIFSALSNAGEPPLTPAPTNALLIDAYAVQHPGQPSAQAIQSVAVHLLALYAVLVKGVAVDRAVWVRQQALREGKTGKRGRFDWLTPPLFSGTLTVADIVKEPTVAARTDRAAQYINLVWSVWSEKYIAIIARWYQEFVESELR